jgi:DNA polymerase elongation subunit (family B)
MNYHGKSIDIQSNISKLDNNFPSREDCLSNQDVQHIYTTFLKKTKPILFLANDVCESYKFQEYELILYGILPCGSKTTVIIHGVYPYLDIDILSDKSDIDNTSSVRNTLKGLDIDYSKVEIVQGKDFMGFNHQIKKYVRIHFRNLKMREACLKLYRQYGRKTYSNNRSAYYRVVAREHKINLASWNKLSSYTVESSNIHRSKYTIRVHIKDIQSFHKDTYPDIHSNLLKFDRTIIGCFDIEMCPGKAGDFPSGKNPEDHLFMICITFHFTKEKKSLLNVCIVSKPCEPQDNLYTIVCSDEKMVLLVFSYLIKKIQPDFLTEFNGSGFDWPAIMDKVQYHNLTSTFLQYMSIPVISERSLYNNNVLDFHFVERDIKITGGNNNVKSRNLKMKGYIPFDTMIIFKQLEPTAEKHSLNHCLKICNLGNKDDLPVEEMFRIYRHGNAEEMKKVAHYCYIDSFKLQQLLIQRNVIQDKREVAILSYTSLYDGFCYANGLKIRNLLMGAGYDKNLMFNTIIDNDHSENRDASQKFPGALVLNPIKGVVCPIFNLEEFLKFKHIECSPEEKHEMMQYIRTHYDDIYIQKKLDVDVQLKDELYQYIEYVKTHENQYPVSGLDFSSLYPSIIMAYNLSPEYLILDKQYMEKVKAMGRNLHHIQFKFDNRDIEAWTVRHDNQESEIGLCPMILIDLFNRRKQLKGLMHPYEQKKDHMEKNNADYMNDPEYDEVVFQFNYYNSKQKALKVFMNTFYGEMGNNLSCIFALEIAGAVTTMGRYNLRLAKNFVENSLKVKTYYGDSVTKTTPIIIRIGGFITIMEIQTIAYKYIYYSNGKEVSILDEDIEVLTESGWTRILKVIRHKTKKKLYRVSTTCGSVDVTEDHSLLDQYKQKLKPTECKIGTELLHWDQSYFHTEPPIYTGELENTIEFIYGIFFASGTYSQYKVDTTFLAYSFLISHQNEYYLDKCIEQFRTRYGNEIQLVYKNIKKRDTLVAMGKIRSLVFEWRSKFYTYDRHKKVPDCILNGTHLQKIAFIRGYETVSDKQPIHAIGRQGLYLLYTQLHMKPYLEGDKIKYGAKTHIEPYCIQSIESLPNQIDYVYDLETASHHFAAGVGQLVVHNTDSLYIACNAENYKELDKNYFTDHITKEVYTTKLIEKTFELIDKYKDLVNEQLIQDNGTKYLKMSYEEVLYPAVFLGKKKYYAIPHIGIVNFKPSKLFIRGLEVIKRGTSDVLKDICMSIMWSSVSIQNVHTIRQLILTSIERYFNTKWEMEYFIKTAVYKPDKQNVQVNTFMSRMQEINYPVLPEAGIRFKYIIAKKFPYTYDIKGRQTVLSIGDKMEFIERARELNMDIDLLYYFNNEITGQLARLLSYDTEFDTYIPSEADKQSMDEKELYKKKEDTIFNNCKKYIELVSKKYSNAFENKGHLFKEIYSKVKKNIHYDKVYGGKMKRMIAILPSNVDNSNHLESLVRHLQSTANDTEEIEKNSKKILQKISKNISTVRLKIMYSRHPSSYVSTMIQSLERQIEDTIKKLDIYIREHDLKDKVYNIHDKNINTIVMRLRNDFHLQDICESNKEVESIDDIIPSNTIQSFTEDQTNFVNIEETHIISLMKLMASIVGKYRIIYLNKRMTEKIEILFNKENNVFEKPKNFQYTKII